MKSRAFAIRHPGVRLPTRVKVYFPFWIWKKWSIMTCSWGLGTPWQENVTLDLSYVDRFTGRCRAVLPFDGISHVTYARARLPDSHASKGRLSTFRVLSNYLIWQSMPVDARNSSKNLRNVDKCVKWTWLRKINALLGAISSDKCLCSINLR